MTKPSLTARAGVVLILFSVAAADEVRFAGEPAVVPCQVVSADQKTVELRAAARAVVRFRLRDRSDPAFPDSLYLLGHKRERPARILAWERGSFLLRVPRRDVTHMKMTPPAKAKAMTEEPRAKSQGAVRRPAGGATGTILVRGKPARSVSVRVVRVAVRTFLGLRRTIEEEASHLATTDESGVYRFERLPVGSYKVYVQLDKKDGWIRRLRGKADFDVKAGKRTRVAPVKIPARVY